MLAECWCADVSLLADVFGYSDLRRNRGEKGCPSQGIGAAEVPADMMFILSLPFGLWRDYLATGSFIFIIEVRQPCLYAACGIWGLLFGWCLGAAFDGLFLFYHQTRVFRTWLKTMCISFLHQWTCAQMSFLVLCVVYNSMCLASRHLSKCYAILNCLSLCTCFFI